MFRLIRATKRARSEPTTDENEIRNAKRGKKRGRARAVTREGGCRKEREGERGKITTEDKRDERKREITREGEEKRKREGVDVPTPLSDRPTRTKPFPPVDSLLAVRLSSAKIQR